MAAVAFEPSTVTLLRACSVPTATTRARVVCAPVCAHLCACSCLYPTPLCVCLSVSHTHSHVVTPPCHQVWGQLVAHDLIFTHEGTEDASIHVPLCDSFMDTLCVGNRSIPFKRLDYDPASGTSVSSPRAAINHQTAFLDASVVYGPDEDRSDTLRAWEGGKLKADAEAGLPLNPDGVFMAGECRAPECVSV